MESKPKYIKDAIAWYTFRGVISKDYVGPRGMWVRCSDLNLIRDKKDAREYYMSAFTGAMFRTAFPYEDWMEEYIGTDGNLTKDERFNFNYK